MRGQCHSIGDDVGGCDGDFGGMEAEGLGDVSARKCSETISINRCENEHWRGVGTLPEKTAIVSVQVLGTSKLSVRKIWVLTTETN